MKKIVTVILLLSVLLAAFAGCGDSKYPSNSKENENTVDIKADQADYLAEKWVKQEIALEASNTYGDPFNDVTLDCVFTSPSGKKLTVPAFWDGGSSFRIRFALNELGIWSFKTVGSDDEGLKKEGTVGCNSYKGVLDIYKHGFVKSVDGTRYFVYDDMTPFFYLGDTHWTMLKEEFASAGTNASDTGADSHFKYIVDARAAQGFTVYQSEPIGANYSLNNGIGDMDIKEFQRIDGYFEYIAQKGFVHANSQLFFTDELVDKEYPAESLEKLTRYWVARYGAYPVMWTTAQEADDDFMFGTSQTAFSRVNNPWKTVTEALHKYDAYSHPLSCHTENGITVKTSAFADIDGYDWIAGQYAVKSEYAQDYTAFSENYENAKLPAVLYESYYENLWTDEYGARVQGYTAFLNGMCGYGYGIGDIWYYKSSYEMDADSTRDVTVTKEQKKIKWGDAINSRNAVNMGWMKNFFTYFDWYKLEPCFGNEKYFTVNAPKIYTAGAHIGDERIVIYVYNHTVDADITVKCLDPKKTYTSYWYNTVTGEYTTCDKEFKADKGEYSVKQKPGTSDYVLTVLAVG